MPEPKRPPGRPPERLPITLRQRVNQHGPLTDEDIMWPKNWPIPSEGNSVSGDVLEGFVERVTYDLVAQRIVVILR